MQIVSLEDNLQKCHILFSRKTEKITTSLSSAELAYSMVSVNV